MRGFALPRAFRKEGLAESLSRNFRELTTFINTFVVRFETDASTVALPGDLTVAGDADVTGDLAVTGTITGVNYDHEAWTAPTLLNSWVDYGGSYQTARYRKRLDGVVELDGMVKNGSSTSATIMTLPVGYRPAAYQIFPVWSNTAVARLDVRSDGTVFMAGGTGSTSWVYLKAAFDTA